MTESVGKLLGKVASMALSMGCGACVTITLASCGSASPLAAVAGQRPIVILRELAVCFRAHGLPDFPDPVAGRDGAARFPDSAPRTPTSAQRACRSIANRLPAGRALTSPIVSPAESLRARVLLAGCIRTHGVPDWPDPNPDGEFSIEPGIRIDKHAVLDAMRACSRVRP